MRLILSFSFYFFWDSVLMTTDTSGMGKMIQVIVNEISVSLFNLGKSKKLTFTFS